MFHVKQLRKAGIKMEEYTVTKYIKSHGKIYDMEFLKTSAFESYLISYLDSVAKVISLHIENEIKYASLSIEGIFNNEPCEIEFYIHQDELEEIEKRYILTLMLDYYKEVML